MPPLLAADQLDKRLHAILLHRQTSKEPLEAIRKAQQEFLHNASISVHFERSESSFSEGGILGVMIR